MHPLTRPVGFHWHLSNDHGYHHFGSQRSDSILRNGYRMGIRHELLVSLSTDDLYKSASYSMLISPKLVDIFRTLRRGWLDNPVHQFHPTGYHA
jgi:hypothetical protein